MYKQRFNPHKRFAPKRNKITTVSKKELMDAIASVEVIQKAPKAEEEIVSTKQFADFPLNSVLKDSIARKGYLVPTPIQERAIPAILEGRDVIGIANTGTGKTAAFLVPLLQKTFENKTKQTLIVAPTRELAVQIRDEFKELAHGLGLFSVLLIGGVGMGSQKADLKRMPHFVIGTPGRIKDLLKERAFSLQNFDQVVLDEADRMVDIGFINDIKYFISLLPQQRQSLFFSATIDGKVQEIIKHFVTNPVKISVAKQATAENIAQDVIHVGDQRKIDVLHNLLAQDGFTKVMIFGRTKWGIQKLTDELVKRGFRAGAIHGNKNQNQRQRVLQQFKNNQITILLATDVASRGLDISDVSHVINYDMPASLEDYVHRIGRTGRADKAGIALTFVD